MARIKGVYCGAGGGRSEDERERHSAASPPLFRDDALFARLSIIFYDGAHRRIIQLLPRINLAAARVKDFGFLLSFESVYSQLVIPTVSIIISH